MKVQPYLFFEGRCEEALDFYKKALGAEVTMLMRFSDAPAQAAGQPEGCAGGPPPNADKIMHAAFQLGTSLLMASDGMAQGKPEFKGVSLSLTASNDAEAERWFAALGDGGLVQQPLISTFFSSRFGMVADRFGVNWMIVVEQ
jgi:PhnB protein